MKKFIIAERLFLLFSLRPTGFCFSNYIEASRFGTPETQTCSPKTPWDWFRVTLKTPLSATSSHHSANPLFDAQCPFTLHPKPSINIKNSINNGSIDFSERSVRGNGGEVQPFLRLCVNELLAKQGSKSLNRWMDNQEVCQQLNISPRTLQTLRDNGTLAYSQINYKVFTDRRMCCASSSLWRTDVRPKVFDI